MATKSLYAAARSRLAQFGLCAFVVAVASVSSAGAEDPMQHRLEAARAALSDSATTKPQSNPEEGISQLGTRMFSGLGICLGAFLVGLHIYRRLHGISPERRRRLQIVDRISLVGKTSLVLAKVDGREILLAVGSERVTEIDNGLIGSTIGNSSSEFESQDLEIVCQREQLKASA